MREGFLHRIELTISGEEQREASLDLMDNGQNLDVMYSGQHDSEIDIFVKYVNQCALRWVCVKKLNEKGKGLSIKGEPDELRKISERDRTLPRIGTNEA